MDADSEIRRGVFNGFWPQAMEAGWQETDYGQVCPLCIFEQDRLESSGEVLLLEPNIEKMVEAEEKEE